MPIIQEFAKLVKEKRREMHKTQEQTAGDCHISTRHLQRIEQERSMPSLDVALRLAKYLGISLDALLADISLEEHSPF